jgi:hypothetical protein
MEKLLDKRTSISAGEFPKLVTCKWPLGRVVLYRDRIVLDARVEKYELLYSEIDRFQFNPVQVNIEHHHPGVISDISINGIFISRIIKTAIRRYNLPVRTT